MGKAHLWQFYTMGASAGLFVSYTEYQYVAENEVHNRIGFDSRDEYCHSYWGYESASSWIRTMLSQVHLEEFPSMNQCRMMPTEKDVADVLEEDLLNDQNHKFDFYVMPTIAELREAYPTTKPDTHLWFWICEDWGG